MAGIYVADPEKLSMQSTFPQFAEMERQYGSLIKAMQQAKKKLPPPNSSSKPKAMFTSLRGGMKELVESLIDQLEGDLRSNSRVVGLHRQEAGFEILLDNADASFKTDALVLAVPAYIAANLTEPFAPGLAELLKQIRYISTATVSLGYRRADVADQHNFNGFGFVIPKSENRKILACTWSSTKFDDRAPNDDVLLRAFVGGDGKEHLVKLPDDELTRLVQSEVADIMGVTAAPVVCKVFRWINGNPQYDVGHLDRVAEIEQKAGAIPGLYLTGSAFRGIGIPDCVKSAQSTVDQIFTHFQS
jgi:oxygen-dependent protoporphyrinogen oxidase